VVTPGINRFIEQLPRSGIRRIMDKAIASDPEQKEIIHLEVGQAHAPSPEGICQSAADAALAGQTKYTQNAGYLQLRHAIRRKLGNSGISATVDSIFVTPGATYGVTVTLGVLINPGDEVLVPDPGYPNFAAAVRMYGGVVRYYTLEEGGGFQIDLDMLSSLTSSKTKAIIINSPSNPTGSVLGRELIDELVAFTGKRGIWLVSDEVYEAFVFAGRHESPLQCKNRDHVIGIFSLSKTYNVTGLRIGYTVAANTVLCDGLLKAQELYISSAPSISQMAAIYALESAGAAAKSFCQEFKMKKDLAVSELKGLVEYDPQGAFYILINIARSGMSSNEFADRLIEKEKVAVAPGLTFGPSSDKYIRIALTPDPAMLLEGIRRIKRMLETRPGDHR